MHNIGQPIYEFYQKYGFTDLEEQIILIAKPDILNLSNDLPLNTQDINRLRKIDARKFLKDSPITFDLVKEMQADIRLESLEYDSGQDKSIICSQGKYNIVQTDSTETIFIFDSKTGLMYIESIKTNK